VHLPPFALNHWLSQHHAIRYDLASSTGPHWSLTDLLRLGAGLPDLAETPLTYASPEGSPALRQAIGAFHGVDPDWVVTTTGGSEALSIFLCLAERPGAEIVIPDPAYPAYAAMAQAFRLQIRTYGLTEADGYSHRRDAIVAATTAQTAAVIVNTPHNPTGAVMPVAEIAALAQDLAGSFIRLLVDEVYHPLYFTAPNGSAAGIPNVTVTSDLSKALCLAGLRTGWLIEPDAALRQRMIDARGYFTISGSPVLERLAAHALIHRAAILARLHATAAMNLPRLAALIDASDGRLAWAPPAGGTTAFPRFTDRASSRPFCDRLAAAGVLLAPGDCFGHPAHLRIGYAQQEQFEPALRIIAEHLA
jgi:aspartate/methionine/tyrosine aminotransferase